MIALQLVTNGNFETQTPVGAGWVFDKLCMTNTPGEPYSGLWCAKLGGYDSVATGYLYQTVEIPEYSIATLSFQLAVTNSGVLSTDGEVNEFRVIVKTQDGATTLGVLGVWTNLHEMAWTRQEIDLSKYANQVVRIEFVSTQTNAAKNTLFFVDEVRIDALLNLPASSFPPLISDKSRDLAGNIQQYGDRVFCSCLISKDPNDLFFNPTFGSGLTGYGWNGSFYKDGAEFPATKAEWWSEAVGGGDQSTRGAITDFPKNGLVLVSEGSISILDRDDSLNMWMIFKKGASRAYSDTFSLEETLKLQPKEVRYNNGKITVLLVPQAGSLPPHPVVLTIDFVEDFIYVETSKE